MFAFCCCCCCFCWCSRSCLPPTTTMHPHKNRRRYSTSKNLIHYVLCIDSFKQCTSNEKATTNTLSMYTTDTKKAQNIYRIKDAMNKDTIKNLCFSYISIEQAKKWTNPDLEHICSRSTTSFAQKSDAHFQFCQWFFSFHAVCCWCKRSKQIFTLIRGYDWQWK